ncbi:MAG TPA: FHA domain-containing protein [Candidatus Binataceae bacterium]|nr:FHA domain-containing protein [Candidatus Binataceae bacterium]
MDAFINRRELTFKALAGLAGGALGWLPVELVNHGYDLTQRQTTGMAVANLIAMAVLSGLIGGFINAAQNQELALTPQMQRRFLIGFGICALLSLPATYYSNRAFSYILTAGGWGVGHAGSMVYLIAARLTGWTLMGLMLGLGVGIATFVAGNLLKGAAGGWVGGFIGGIAFDAIGALTHAGLLSRLFGLSAIGLAIGLFIGLVQELTKVAWLRVEDGRLRGREYRLDKGMAFLGRAEECEIGLFGDSAVAPQHAQISRRGSEYILKDLTRNPGTLVNGQRIESKVLAAGDLIQIGNYALRFNLRTVSAPALAQPYVAPSASSVVATPPAAHNPTPSLAAAQANGGARLINSIGQSLVLRPDAPTRLGRALDNDLVVADQSVSRHHATISWQNGGYYLQDLGSQNGTYVGGQRVNQALLVDGARVKLGDAEFDFRV